MMWLSMARFLGFLGNLEVVVHTLGAYLEIEMCSCSQQHSCIRRSCLMCLLPREVDLQWCSRLKGRLAGLTGNLEDP